MSSWQNWQYEVDADQIGWLTIDRQDAAVNTLGRAVVAEFLQVLDSIEQSMPKAVVLQSGKSSGFIFGADITEFLDLKDEQAAFDLIYTTQQALNRWEALPIPTVAIISGMCLGGGLEFALATRYRVADSEHGTKLGLPEVKLGIQPGWGGTVRLPRIVGVAKAMPLMLTGRLLDPKRAKRVGFVDKVQPLRHCRAAALDLIHRQPRPHSPGAMARFASSALVRPLLASKIRKGIKQQGILEKHYPAPYAMVRNWQKHGVSDSAYKAEAQSIARLMMTPTARQLVRVFFMQSKLKATAKGPEFAGQHIHVVGAGTMGGDIAAWCALQGFRVTLQDQSVERIAPAIKRAVKLYQKKLRSPRLVRLALDRLQPDVTGDGAKHADIIIEAIFEDLAVKQELFLHLEQVAKPSAILATNTSSIPLHEIGAVLRDSSRLVGIHFFNPVSQMQLVEVVSGDETQPEIAQQAARFVKDIKRFPLPVKSRPGFLVNRVLMPYLLEAITMFGEGVSVEEIDRAALEYGMPMGPIRLADTVGLDVCLSVAKNLLPVYGGEIPATLQDLVNAGNLGAKTKQGFYRYKGRAAEVVVKPSKSCRMAKQDIADRLIYRQLNEAIQVWREGVVSDLELVDAGMIYGTGFAPFRGGPIQAAKTAGVDVVCKRFNELAQLYGERFVPDSGWSSLSDHATVAESVSTSSA